MAHKAREFWLKKLGMAGPAFLVAVPILLGFYLLYAASDQPEDLVASLESNKSQTPGANALFLDPDEDGLKNWEEELYGTNPNNPDSNANGVSDRDEVLSAKVSGDVGAIGESSAPEKNLTESIIGKFIESGGAVAITKGKEGYAITSELLTEEIERLSKEGSLPRPIPVTPLEATPVLTSDDTSAGAIRAYLNAAATVISRNTSGLKKDNLDLLVEIIQSGDLARLTEFAAYRNAAEQIVRELSGLRVPKNLSWYHKRQIFLMNQMALHLAAFEGTEQDPLKTLALVEPNIQVKEELLILNRNELWEWLANQKIVLKPSDKAYSIIY